MATLPAEEKLDFLIRLLATGEFTPNYAALAKDMGINTSNNAQRRFKGIVEADKKFILQSSKEGTSIAKSGEAGDGEADSGTPKKTPKSTKGRKRNKPATEDGDEQDKTPSKVPKKTRKDQDDKLNEDGLEDNREGFSKDDDLN